MHIDVDSRVTPTLHPKCIEHLDGYTEETAPYVASAVTAFTTAYQAVVSVHNARSAARSNPVWNPAEQVIRTDDLAKDKFAAAAAALDRSYVDLGKKSDHIEGILNQPLVSKASLSISQEIRAHVKAMDMGERLAFIRSSIDNGDETTVTALLGAPGYLCGLDEDAHRIHCRMWHEKKSPELAAQLKVIQGARNYISAKSGLLFDEMEKAVGVLTDPDSGRKYTPHELREAKKASEAAFYGAR